MPTREHVRLGTRVLVLALAIMSTMAIGQEIEPPTIVAVRFEGLDKTSPAFLQGIIGIEAGDRFEREIADEAMTKLLATGRFLGADYRTEETARGVVLVVTLFERPTITAVRFVGNTKLGDNALRTAVGIAKGEQVDLFRAREGIILIRNRYRDKGYSNVAISYDEDTLVNSGALIYEIDEGERVRIEKIIFEGASAFPRRKLMQQITTKPKLSFFRAGAFDEDTVIADAAALQTYYRSQGFLDARVSYRRDSGQKPGNLVLSFVVSEGAKYTIESISIDGNESYTDQELRNLLTCQVGDTALQQRIETDVREIQKLYGEYGFIDARVRATRAFSDTPGLIELGFSIDEGEQFKVGKIIVRGNTRTRDKVIRRELNLYPPDDFWNMTAARDAEKGLQQGRIFKSARVLPIGNEPGVRNALIEVEEVERVGDFIFGGSVTSNSGVVGNVVLNIRNFDIKRSPRTFKEFVKFKSFFGGGQQLRLELQPGTELSRFRIDFTEPYLFDKPLRLSTSAYLFDRGREAYNEGRGGAGFSLGKTFKRGFLRGWTGEFAVRAESVNISDLYILAARDIRDVEGRNFISSLKFGLVRDRTDSRFVPASGDRIRFSCEQTGVFGGDYTFSKLTAGYTRYFTMHTDRFDRKHVLQLKGEAGVIIGDAPVFERFYMGGIGSLRGFSYRGVGPRQGLDRNNVGGDWKVLASSEYSFPLYGEHLRGLFFIDAGTVESGMRASVGGGVRLMVNLLGPLPLEFNLGFPLMKEEDDETQAFSFFIGTQF